MTGATEQRDVVLAHEIAHLAGHDPLRHVAARLAVAFYWFHPLAWMAARQAAAAREQACDEAVLALGTRPSAYARVLLELAESMQPSAAGLGALPMVERSHLETRLMAILNDDVPCRAERRGVVIPAIGVVLCTLASRRPAPAVRRVARPRRVARRCGRAAGLGRSRGGGAPAPAQLPVDVAERGAVRGIADSACAPDGRPMRLVVHRARHRTAASTAAT